MTLGAEGNGMGRWCGQSALLDLETAGNDLFCGNCLPSEAVSPARLGGRPPASAGSHHPLHL